MTGIGLPADPAGHRDLAEQSRAQGDELAALAHLLAAQVLEAGDAHAGKCLADVGTGYFMKNEHATARRWYELALRLDCGLAVAWQNLAVVHAQAGDHRQAEQCRDRAYGLQRVFVEDAGQPRRRVVLLCSGRTSGNVPFDLLVPTPDNCRIKYAIDYAAPAEDATLPASDLAFNAIGEPDIAEPLAERLCLFARHYAKPLLNPPERIAATRRDRLPALLDAIAGLQTARCLRLDDLSAVPASTPGALVQWLDANRLALPLLVRPAASHGGAGLTRCTELAGLDTALRAKPGPGYLSAYRDCRSPDGYYRKYRVLFVDRRPYPYHLAISPHWMVHYYSADMLVEPWKREEEARFLADPQAELGAPAWSALTALGRRLDLDYAGIDFAQLANGTVFVFEANATMLAHRERPGGPLAHKNSSIQRIADAFEHLLQKHSA
ncbi:RimK family alpha-L-glutamate ligase [Bordetella sp. FB-8]|uniref:ATP-grasp domain-containing protein n=1 Tax=Bordetella sp. FB-8 TaxID=1159870 RepID=UPI0003811F79|nr:hypothetical protein [Bordetella sp. FB-8]